jgi:hypothetical protein
MLWGFAKYRTVKRLDRCVTESPSSVSDAGPAAMQPELEEDATTQAPDLAVDQSLSQIVPPQPTAVAVSSRSASSAIAEEAEMPVRQQHVRLEPEISRAPAIFQTLGAARLLSRSPTIDLGTVR